MSDEWRTDDRPENTLQIGAVSRVSQTHRTTGDTAHLLTFSDGRQIRVLPDGTSGQRRSRAVRAAMVAAEPLRAELSALIETYIIGHLTQAGLTWEAVTDPDRCDHQIEAGSLDTAPNGETYATVVCARCGQKWWGMVSPMAASVTEVTE